MKKINWIPKDNFQMFDARRPLELLIIHSQLVVSSFSKNKITWLVGTKLEQEEEVLVCEEFIIACKLHFHSARNLQTDLRYFNEVLN